MSVGPHPTLRVHLDRPWLVGGLFLGVLIWIVCGLIVSVAVAGPVACLFEGDPTGWTESAGAVVTAAAIGLVLWLMGGVVAARLPDRKGRVMLAYATAYIGALVIFCTAIAPEIWGHFACVR